MKRYHFLSVLAIAIAVSSCGAVADLSIRADRSVSLSLAIEVPASVEVKIRQFSSAGGGSASSAPLFDAVAVSASIKARGAVVEGSASPSSRAYRGSFSVKDLESLLTSDGQLADIMEYKRGPGWASFGLTIDRGNAAAVAKLFPGIDSDVLEALQPPAIYDNPVTPAEYRSMLAGLMGKAAVGAMDVLAFKLSVSVPGAIMECTGDTRVEGGRSFASLNIPALDALVLERPISFFVKWKE